MALRNAQIPGTVTDIPVRWPEPAKEVRWHPKEPPPIGRLLAANPSLFARLMAGEIPIAASLPHSHGVCGEESLRGQEPVRSEEEVAGIAHRCLF